MEETEHICEPDVFDKISYVRMKKLIGGRRRISDPFTCGGCCATFTTVCSLHLHCQKHNEGGSYFFDSLTRTAFPKYDTACVYTQVTSDLLLQAFQGEEGKTKQAECKNLTQSDVPSVRVSKRIANRKGKGKGKHKSRNETEDSVELDQCVSDSIAQGYHTPNKVCVYKVKDDGTEAERTDTELHRDSEHEYKPNAESPCLFTTENSPGVKQQKRSRKRKAKQNDAETMTDYLTDDENINKYSDKTRKMANAKMNVSNYKKKYNKKNKRAESSSLSEAKDVDNKVGVFTSGSHITDELTASEVLLAISKGDSADLTASAIDDSTDTENTKTESNNMSMKGETGAKEEQGNDSKSSKAANKPSACGIKEYECKTCGKKGTGAMLTYHKYLHMDRKSFACDVCGLLFQIPRSLVIHKRQHEEKQFRCEHCPAAFHRKQYLDTHLRKHTGELPYMCDLCGKAYRDRSHLKRHIKHVHENVRDFSCDICSEKFYRSDHLKNHRLRHFVADKKCVYCNRLFKHPEDLIRHTRTHTGEKEWYCHICGHGFVAVTPYYTHMAKKHSITKEEAKIWKKRSREDNKQRRLKQKDPSSDPAAAESQTTGDDDGLAADTGVATSSRVTVVPTDTGLVPLRDIHDNKSDVSTYVDLPAVDNSALETTGSNLLMKFAGSSESSKTAAEEDILGVQGAVVTDMLPVSEVGVGESVVGQMVHSMQDRDRIQLSGDSDFNVIIAVDGMSEFGPETVMFIDGDQCQSEVIIDN